MMEHDLCPRAEILPTHTAALFETAVARAVDWLRAGKLVALPTETVYGLAANALAPEAVARIFTVKARPAHNPIIVHVGGLAMAKRCVAHWSDLAEKLASAFWPGPLTLVLPRAAEVPDAVTAGGPTVGVRWPRHALMQAVIRACDFPLAAPSANLSSQVSPTTAAHVWKALGDRIGLIIDGGPTPVGIESTVLDLSSATPRLLRPGMIHTESLRAVTGELQGVECGAGIRASGQAPLRSPGQLPRHYAPQAKLVVWRWHDDADLKSQITNNGFKPEQVHVLAHTRLPRSRELGRVCAMEREVAGFARSIYAELHRCDEAGARLIVVEELPEEAAWQAISDRLRRAAVEIEGHGIALERDAES